MKTTSFPTTFMPVRLLPQLRLLSTSLPATHFPPMKFAPTLSSSRAVPILSRVFPLRLRYMGLGFRRSLQTERAFSTRAFRGPRTGSGSELPRGYERRAGGASKSLIEDEAELSDWVSELRSDSPRGREDDLEGRRGRVRERGTDRESYPMKKSRRESDSGDFGESRRRDFRSPNQSFPRNGGISKRFDNKSEGDKKDRPFPPRNNRGNSNSSGEFGDSSRRRFPNPNESFSRNSGISKRFDNKFQSDDDKEDGLFPRRSNRGNSNSFSKGNSSSNLKADSFTRNRGVEGLRRGGRETGKTLRVMDDTEEEEEKPTVVRIEDLLSEEESDTAISDDDDGYGVLREKSATSLFGLDNEVSVKVLPKSSPGSSDSYLSESRFDHCSVSPLSLKGIKDAGYEKMTVVQEATLPVILKGKDVLAKAKTGTGKTVAFLLPSIEVVVKSPPITRDQKRPPILVLVICPTRELASQASAEANKLLKYHPSIGVQVVIGGTRLALEQKRIQANPCQILVATPGRLKDHIENTAGFATRLMGVKVLVLDEADHLLDMGFRKDIERIISAVPKQRQTLLFSATVPEEVRQICHIALKRDHEYINTVQEGSEETHAQVRQTHLVAPLDKHFSLVYALLKEHIADDVEYKVLVFCTTAMVTRLVADLLGELNLNVREIHSRKPQSYRTRVSDEFRKSKGLILVTSDVSARGVDYPDVTLVIQVGVPADRQQYIHRLGRTGRKGKEGQGILLLAPWEEFFLSTIKDLPITKGSVPSVDPDTTKKVERALSKVEMKNKEAAYQAWLGYYNSNKKVGRDKHRLVELANEFSRSMGLDNPPAIPKLVLGKMGLKNVPGLRSK
ncbi:hypothetical protein CerSpe_084160 [Prunus speciosa]